MMNNKLFWLMIIFLTSFTIYWLTLCPTVYWGDSADFASACWTRGIPHSTGYPLYTLCGTNAMFLGEQLFSGKEPVYWLNLTSVFFGAGSVSLLCIIIIVITNDFFAGIISSFVFAFLNPFWEVSTIAEVYTFNVFLLLLFFLIILLWLQKPDAYKLLYLGMFILGLSLANHLSLVSIIPAVVYILYHQRKILSSNVIITMCCMFLLGLTPYLYIFLRAQLSPVINSGESKTISLFFRFIFQRDFSYLIFQRTPIQILKITGVQFYSLLKEFTFVCIPFVIIGIIKCKKDFFSFSIFAFLGLMVLLSLYGKPGHRTPEADSIFLPGFALFITMTGIGIHFISDMIKSHFKRFGLFFIFSISLIPVWLMYKNFDRNNKRNYFFAYDYAINLLNMLPENGIFLAFDNSYVFSMWYLQNVKNLRTDVKPIFYIYLFQEWYQQQLKRLQPAIIIPSLKRNQKNWSDGILKFIEYNLNNFWVYTDFHPEYEKILKKKFFVFPVGLGFALTNTAHVSVAIPTPIYRIPEKFHKDETVKTVFNNYALTHDYLGKKYLKSGQFDLAINEFNKIVKLIGVNTHLLCNLGIAYYNKRDKNRAIQYWKESLKLEPSNPVPLKMLQRISK